MILMGLAGLGAGCAGSKESAADRPERAAAKLVRALGGERRLAKIQFVRFEIVRRLDDGRETRRAYWFDRRRDLCRIEGARERTGSPFSTVVNLKTRQGKALVGYRSKATEEPAILNEFIDDALRDSDWLFGPALLREASLTSVGVRNIAGQPSPTLDATLPGPPARHYLAHLTTKGDKLLAWTVFSSRGAPQASYLVSEWRAVRKFNFPVRFERIAGSGPRVILVENLIAPENIDAELFFRP